MRDTLSRSQGEEVSGGLVLSWFPSRFQGLRDVSFGAARDEVWCKSVLSWFRSRCWGSRDTLSRSRGEEVSGGGACGARCCKNLQPDSRLFWEGGESPQRIGGRVGKSPVTSEVEVGVASFGSRSGRPALLDFSHPPTSCIYMRPSLWTCGPTERVVGSRLLWLPIPNDSASK